MLDTFEILTTSGVVLWSRTYVPVSANVINSLIRDVFIEERIQPQSEDAGSKPTYRKDGYTLKWTAAKDLGLIFVVTNTARPWVVRSFMANCFQGRIPESRSLDMDRQAPRQRARIVRRPLWRTIEDGA